MSDSIVEGGHLKRMARCVIDGRTGWVESTETGAYYLISGNGTNPGPERVRALTRKEVALITFLPPFFGRKVIGLAFNYKSLVGPEAAFDEPLFFLKSPTSVCLGGAAVCIPAGIDAVWVECELAIVIGRGGRDIAPEAARSHILGHTIASDMTARNVLGRDHHLARSKALDQFCPIVPWVTMGFDATHASVETRINGHVFQSGDISDRIYDDAQCIALVSRFVTLDEGDLILTGTPAGAMESLVTPGDEVMHTISGIGTLEFSIDTRTSLGT